MDGLFSVLVTLGVVPIIRCPKASSWSLLAADACMQEVRFLCQFYTQVAFIYATIVKGNVPCHCSCSSLKTCHRVTLPIYPGGQPLNMLASQGGAAEYVATQLDVRLREHLKLRSNLLNEGAPGLAASLSRPMLCLFDRSFELSVVCPACRPPCQCLSVSCDFAHPPSQAVNHDAAFAEIFLHDSVCASSAGAGLPGTRCRDRKKVVWANIARFVFCCAAGAAACHGPTSPWCRTCWA